jgi:hypothetical protein
VNHPTPRLDELNEKEACEGRLPQFLRADLTISKASMLKPCGVKNINLLFSYNLYELRSSRAVGGVCAVEARTNTPKKSSIS